MLAFQPVKAGGTTPQVAQAGGTSTAALAKGQRGHFHDLPRTDPMEATQETA